GDEAHCRQLCERLGVPLHVERVVLPAAGNLQPEARNARYATAERLAEGDYAAAHTRSDQAEPGLYRLSTSPGRSALLGVAPRGGGVRARSFHAHAWEARPARPAGRSRRAADPRPGAIR